MLQTFEGFTMPAYLISYDCDGEPQRRAMDDKLVDRYLACADGRDHVLEI